MKINANKNEINILIEESEEINIEDLIQNNRANS